MERCYLADVVGRLQPRARVLDRVAARASLSRVEYGFVLTGVDAVPAICKEPFGLKPICAGSSCPFAHAIVAWDSFFHLTRDDQRSMFPVLAKHVTRGGLLLFTSGPRDGI